MEKIKKIIKHLPGWYALAGSFIISSGWNWYHAPHKRFMLIYGPLYFAAIYIGYALFKFLYVYLTKRFNRHVFWQEDFKRFLDPLFFNLSLVFLIFFFQNEIFSFLFVLLMLAGIYWQLDHYFKMHPNAAAIRMANRSVFCVGGFIFIISGILQYVAYYYYILDSNIKFYDIVTFRAFAMTMFWLMGFAVGDLIYWRFKSWLRYVFLSLWTLLFAGSLVFWLVNIGILYYSGLYFSPTALDHAEGASNVIWNHLTYLLLVLLLIVIVIFGLVMKHSHKAHKNSLWHYWYFYDFTIVALALVAIFGISSFRNTPEAVVIRSFYSYFTGNTVNISLDPIVQQKLEKFGITYNLNNFYLAHKDTAFTASKPLLPAELLKNKPNVIVIFWESLSARLNGVYNTRFADVTPGLVSMASDPHTTVFKNYYNASTPTITGLLSQLCSFLPPTGHNEINNDKMLQRQYLLCLPKILRSAGYKDATYVTSVEKDYAHKDTLFDSMGTDRVLGQEELKSLIAGAPLSWGYSDHQTFPVIWQMAQKEKNPFLLMLSTVDTHPPFNLAQDTIPYGDGKSDVLNAYHTTDDAFAKFWQEFKQSPLYNNTILIVAADHAVFPAAFKQDLFPDIAGKLTYYDENSYMMYIPNSILPKQVDTYASGIDFTPTLLQILNINSPNAFEGHSIFDDRKDYPNLLGMHELGLYINQVEGDKRVTDYNIPTEIDCDKNEPESTSTPLTLCEYLNYYQWKRQMFDEGRFWEIQQ